MFVFVFVFAFVFAFVFQDKIGETTTWSRNVWEESADTGFQVIWREAKQLSFVWLSSSQCGDVCDCNSQFSGCLRVELS